MLALRLRSGQALKAGTTQNRIFPQLVKPALIYIDCQDAALKRRSTPARGALR